MEIRIIRGKPLGDDEIIILMKYIGNPNYEILIKVDETHIIFCANKKGD